MSGDYGILEIGIALGTGMLGLALLCAVLRLIRGPDLADRVVALDLIALISVGIITINAVRTGHAIYLDAAIALALISFLGTVAFAFYLEQGGTP